MSDPRAQDLPDPGPEGPRGIWPRIIWVAAIAVMISLSQTLLLAVAVLQLVLMLANHGRPNEELADFGAMIGAWVAKAARYQSGASDEKPWPWRPMGN
jgi:hypothetical protein